MEIKDYFYYDETSPSCLRWKVRKGSRAVKDQAVGTLIDGYYRVKLNGKTLAVHRVIWEILNGEIPEGLEIDHKDRVRSNNKIGNLRLATKETNSRNKTLRFNSKTGVNQVIRRTMILKNGNTWDYWTGIYVNLQGKQLSKSFGVIKYGEGMAKSLAVQFVEDMHKLFMDYSRTHGKPLDKTVADSYEECVAQLNSAKGLK